LSSSYVWFGQIDKGDISVIHQPQCFERGFTMGFVVCRGPEVEASSFSGRGDLRILEACLADTVQENSGGQLCEVVSKCRPLF
jgi:hypothetical protein